MVKSFEDVIDFHGHICPGLALGYRVSVCALKELIGERASDEELVAIVENNSCAIDAVQIITGCTFGKGNLIFNDYGKQVYTFIKRSSGNSIRISVNWESPKETKEEKYMWNRYIKGDHSNEVLEVVHSKKSDKVNIILNANEDELLKVTKGKMDLPEKAKIYPSLRCSICWEKVMKPKTKVKNGNILCYPCFEKDN
ncbi:MAG: hypothetical protein A2Y97_03225 [Nitrospirae bacterium RBG_13_39_12]|nr:MAG: hypothetical protein A2Y97_03225 [Nitrospirae bacterium RBG_13_39_12]